MIRRDDQSYRVRDATGGVFATKRSDFMEDQYIQKWGDGMALFSIGGWFSVVYFDPHLLVLRFRDHALRQKFVIEMVQPHSLNHIGPQLLAGECIPIRHFVHLLLQ